MENEKKRLKIMIISMSVILCIFVLAGIVLTIVLKSKQGDLSTLNKQNYDLIQDYNEAKEKDEYYSSDDYNDDYFEREEGYGKDGDKKIDIVDEDNNNN